MKRKDKGQDKKKAGETCLLKTKKAKTKSDLMVAF
jgi:hypothetical protein